MATCPVKSSKEWKELVTSVGNDEAIYLWDKYKGFVPEYLYKLSEEEEVVDTGMNQFNSKLSQKLLDFLKGLNITTQFNQDELLKSLDFENDPLAGFDTLQKFLALGSNATEKDLVRQTANIIYTFLGKKSELGVSIWKSVDKWEGYQRVYDKFKNNRKTISEDIEYSRENFNVFAHKQAIIEFLSEIIERGIDNNFNPSNLENPDLNKQYFLDRNYRNKYEKNLIIKLYNDIWNFVQKYILRNKISLEKSAVELREVAMDIVNDVFEKDYKKFIRVYAEKDGTIKNIQTDEEYNQKDYQDTLDKDPFAKRIIQNLFNNPFIDYKLSGSQVVRKYGTLFRSLSEDLHDIDGVITLDQFMSEENALKFKLWLKRRGKELMLKKKQKQFQKEILPFLEDQSWYKNIQSLFPTWTLESAFIGRDHVKQESVTITGYVEHPTETETTENGEVRPKRYILDFFLRTDEGNYPEIYDNYWKDWKQIFEAKLNMGRAKDLNDLIYFTPFKSDKYKFTNKGFRYFTFLDSRTYEEDNKGIFYQVSPNQVDYNLRAINILQSDKAKQIFAKGKKNGWDLNKILTELQVPKEQKQIILDKNIKEEEVDTFGQTIFNRKGENINKKVLETLENIVRKSPENYLGISSDFDNTPNGYIVLRVDRLFDSQEIKDLYTNSGGFFADKSDIKSNNVAMMYSLLDEFTQFTNIVDDSFTLTRPFGFNSEAEMLNYITKNSEKFIKDDLFFKISKGEVGTSPIILRNKSKDFIPKKLKFVKPKLNTVKASSLREEIITSLLADNSFVVEINTAKNKLYKTDDDYNNQVAYLIDDGLTEEEAIKIINEKNETPSEYYSDLTVPGGTNYTENEIATPAITPSIRGHAQFATDKGIGWFRSDEQLQSSDLSNEPLPIFIEDENLWIISYKKGRRNIDIEGQSKEEVLEKYKKLNLSDEQKVTLIKNDNFTSKTRRILEVQSDLFQKGRGSKLLTGKYSRSSIGSKVNYKGKIYTISNKYDGDIFKFYDLTNENETVKAVKANEFQDISEITPQNQFLQLLNKDNNWVTFFVKSIIQDSAKKGYEKVLFPKGNTAAKIEGHQTLEEFKKRKKDRITELENQKKTKAENTNTQNLKILKNNLAESTSELEKISLEASIKELEAKSFDTTAIDDEIKQLKQELADVESGQTQLSSIANFYETTIANILKKNGYNPVEIKDEYGNTWNEVLIVPAQANETILFQRQTEQPATKASSEILTKVKEVIKKMGVSMQLLTDYAKGNPDINLSGVNAVADLAANIIAIAEGKEGVALTEEMVHIATAIIQQKNPQLITEMISKIGGFKIYKDTLAEYRNLKEYQLPNGKPDIRKIKKEAVDKLIAEIIADGNVEEYTEDVRSLARKFLDAILDWFRVNVRKTNIDIFKASASAIIEGDFEGDVSDISSNEIYFQLSNQQVDFQNKIEDTNKILKKEEGRKDDNPATNTESDSNNFYKVLENGVFRKVATRVTDYVNQWYENTFGGPYVAPDEKTEKQNEQKKNFGLKYHDYFDEIAKRYFNSDGTRRVNPDPRPVYDNKVDNEIYTKLEKYFTDLIEEYSKDGKSPLFFSELKVYDSKDDVAGTIDLVIIEEDGTAHIYDWKFMSFYINDNGDLDSQDVPWFKKGAYSTQLREYKRILKDAYNIKKFGKNRFIPIIMDLREQVSRSEDGKLYITGINIGSVNPKKLEPLYLVPVSEESELTGNESIDRLIKELNTIWKSLELKKEGLTVTEREFKNQRMNLLKTAVRRLRSGKNIGPLIEVIETQTTEAREILDKMSAYMQLPADTDEITEKQKSDLAISATNYIAVADILGTSFDEIGDLIYKKGEEKEKGLSKQQKKEIKFAKKLLREFQETTTDIRRSKVTIQDNLTKFVDKFVGEVNLVTGLSSPEPLLKNFWKKNFSTASAIGLKSVEVLSKMLNLATSKANQTSLSEVNELVEIQKRIIESGGDIKKRIKSLYQTKDDNIVNKLIYRYQKAYRDEADEIYKKSLNANTVKEVKKLKQWVNENVEIDEYKKEASKILNDLIEKQKRNLITDPKTGKKYYSKRVQNKILEYKQKYDIDRDDFTGYNNYIVKRHPKQKWESKEYIALKKDKPLFDLYNFITRFNEKANDVGYISNKVGLIFLPFIRKGTAEQLAWDMSISPIKQFSNALTLQADTIGYGNINELTTEIENSIPKYYTYDFTTGKDKKLDTSELSMELFKNMILYIKHVNRYSYLKDIEGQVQALKTTQKFKKNYITGNQDMIARGPGGELQTTSGDMTNVNILDSFIKSGLYDQKYTEGGVDIAIPNVLKGVKRIVNTVSRSLVNKDLFSIEESPDSFSLQRSMDFLNRYIQMKALGGEFISGAVNSFGTTIQLSAQSGVYFSTREVMKKQYEIARNTYKNDEDKQMFVQLVDKFMPLKDDPTYDKLRKAGLTGLTRVNTSDLLFMFFRFPEQVAEKAVFATLLDNTMVIDGKLVNIKDYVRKKYPNRYTSGNLRETEKIINAEIKELKDTKSISATKKLENGKVVIPGLDLNNIKELQKLTSLTRAISRSATGGQTEYDTNLANQNVWMRSAMVFKNWIPKLAGTRFAEFRKVTDGLSVEIGEDGLTTGEKYDIGRIRLFFGVLGSSIINQSNDIYNIMVGNDKGIERLDQMFLKYQENLMNKRGETLNLSKEEFYDLIRNNLRNEIKELAVMLSLMGVVFTMGMIAPDDDKDKASKNMYRFAQRTVDRFLSELLFFYNPGEMTQTLSGGIPAVGIFKDISRFTSHFTKEITGLDYSNPLRSAEEVRKNAQPIKNAMKLFPISKSFVNYFAIFDEEFAKEFDVTIQKTSR